MASTINDYSLELQWKGDKVTKGIDALEARMNRLAQKASRLTDVQTKAATAGVVNRNVIRQTQQRDTTVPYSKYDAVKRSNELAALEKNRIGMINQTNAQIRRMDTLLAQQAGKEGQRANLVRQQLQDARNELISFQSQWKKGSVTSKQAMTQMVSNLSPVIDRTQRMHSEARLASREFGVMNNISKRLGATWLAMGASGLGAGAMLALAGGAYKANKEFQKMDVSMLAAFETQAEADKQMQYASVTAEKYGLDIFAVGEGWSKMAYSAKMANMPLSEAQSMFENLAVSSRAFGLSADDTKGAMRAVIQMMGKGKVNAEDLRQQLAERLPAAIPLLAKSMGISVSELEDQMKAGAIPASKLIGMFELMAKSVKDSGALTKSLKGLEAQQTRMTNRLKKSAKDLFGGELNFAIGRFFGMISDGLDAVGGSNALGDLFAGMVDGVIKLAEYLSPIAGVTATIVSGWSQIFNFIRDASEIAGRDFGKQSPLVQGLMFIIASVNEAIAGWKMLHNLATGKGGDNAGLSGLDTAGAVIRERRGKGTLAETSSFMEMANLFAKSKGLPTATVIERNYLEDKGITDQMAYENRGDLIGFLQRQGLMGSGLAGVESSQQASFRQMRVDNIKNSRQEVVFQLDGTGLKQFFKQNTIDQMTSDLMGLNGYVSPTGQ